VAISTTAPRLSKARIARHRRTVYLGVALQRGGVRPSSRAIARRPAGAPGVKPGLGGNVRHRRHRACRYMKFVSDEIAKQLHAGARPLLCALSVKRGDLRGRGRTSHRPPSREQGERSSHLESSNKESAPHSESFACLFDLKRHQIDFGFAALADAQGEAHPAGR